MPFKTKVVPDWKIQKEGKWGKTYPKATYPEREKQEIKLFDLKGFVDKKREEKINKMTEEFSSSRKSMMPFNPSMPIPDFKSKATGSDFKPELNIDDLIKRIDSKIAELEKEEEEERKKSMSSNENDIKTEESKKEEKNIDIKNNKPVSDVTDDQFFDDFFYDED